MEIASRRPHIPEETFAETLRAARAGAEWAWASIYHDLAPSVLGYLRARGAHEPEDLTGTVFLDVVRDLRQFDGDARAFRAWVFAIARNRLVDDVRRRARRPSVPTSDEPAGEEVSRDAEDEAFERIGREHVLRILVRLSPDQRDVLALRVLADLTVDEVARVLGKSPGAVKALQRRGLQIAARALAKEGVTL